MMVFDQAANGGGTVVVAWGAVLFGGWRAIRSLRRDGESRAIETN